MQRNPHGNELTIISNASGPGILAADQLIASGGNLSQLGDSSVKNLKSILPLYCNIFNPIDVLEEAKPERFRKVIQVCLNDPAINNVLVIYTPLSATNSLIIANTVIELAKQTQKKLFVSLMGADNSCQEARRLLHKNGIQTFKTPEEATRTFMYTYAYTQNLKLLYQTPEELPSNVDIPIHLKATIRHAFCEGRKTLNLPESLCFLEAYNIPVVSRRVAFTVEDATAIASEFSYLIVMKTLFSHPHLSSEDQELSYEVCSPSEIQLKFGIMANHIRNLNSQADFQGIAIQPKTQEKGHRLFVGSRKDPKFGVAILFGTAGTSTGSVTEISVGFPPLNQILARQILENSKDLQILQAIQNISSLQIKIVEQILVKISQLASDFPEILEIDTDPIVVTESTVFAENVSITIDRERIIREVADHHEHMIIAPYPRKYIAKRTLKNGAQVKLRPIKPEDEARFNELFKSLSEESIRFRFFETIKELSHDTLTRYCNLDYDKEIAIVAELENEHKIIGAVRLVLDGDGKSGEFAIMVGDLWHGLGLGSKLMDHLVDIANDLKLETIYSYVTRANTKMVNMCTKKGFDIKALDEYTINMIKKISI
jgi:acetyltransferase